MSVTPPPSGNPFAGSDVGIHVGRVKRSEAMGEKKDKSKVDKKMKKLKKAMKKASKTDLKVDRSDNSPIGQGST
jgi:hypothetical protein